MTFQDVSIHFSIFDCVHENLKLKVCFYGKQGFWAKRVICMKQQQHKGLKLTQMIFWGKILHWVFLHKKWPKMSFLTNWYIEFLIIYSHVLQHKGWKLGETYFDKILVLGFWGIFFFFFLLKPSWLVNCDCELKVCFFLF